MKKQKMLKSMFSLFLALCMVFGAAPVANFAGLIASAVDVRSGSPAVSTAYWEFYEDGELVFIGNIPEQTDPSQSPWKDTDGNDYVNEIKSVTITGSVHTIGAYGFTLLPVGVVGIPTTVTAIDAKAFDKSSIKTVYFEGTKTEWDARFSGVVEGLRVYYNHNHNEMMHKHSTEATCIKKGYEGDIYCSLCGAFNKKGGYTPTTDHKWSTAYAYITGKEPTCSKPGYQAHFCETCGMFDYSSQESIPATGKHNWVVLPGDRFQDTTTPNKDLCDGHIGQRIVMHCADCNIASSSAQFQVFTYKYKVGDKTYDSGKEAFGDLTTEQQKSVVNAAEVEYNQQLRDDTTVKADKNHNAIHHYVNTVTDATCTVAGKVDVTCEWCIGFKDSYPIKAKGHSDASGDVLTKLIPATCTSTGTKETYCKVCGELLYTETIPNNHTKGYYSGTWKTIQEATCVNDGWQHLFCNYCGEKIKDENGNELKRVLSKTPDIHKESRWFTILEPTCTEKGEQVKICTQKDCPYYSDNAIGLKAVKISDRKALDTIIKVTKDVNRDHFDYSKDNSLTNDEKVYDVANEINMTIMAAYQSGDDSKLTENLTKVFTTAVKYHGYEGIKKDGTKGFIYDEDNYELDNDGNLVTTCIGEATGSVRFVFSEIIAEAVKRIIDRESVINTADDIVAALEEAWTNLGTKEIETVITANKDLIAKITDKALDKQEIPALNHEFERCPYVVRNDKFVPVTGTLDADGNPIGKWYEVKKETDSDNYVFENGKPVKDESKEITDLKLIITKVNCNDGGGSIIRVCTRCGALDEPTLVRPGSHDNYTTHINATCYDNGYDLIKCSKCDYEQRIQTDIKLTHNYAETTIKESTCSKAGIKVKICTHCGDVDKSTYQTLALLPHNDSAVNEAATCLEDGRKGVVCAVCGRFSGEILPALDHSYKKEVIPPSCTEIGYTVSTCTRCGDALQPTELVPAKGHQWGPSIKVAPTCEEGSYTFRVCSVCTQKDKIEENPDALGHDMVTDPAVEPGCETPGHTERIYCQRPGCTYVEKESDIIPPKGHTPLDVGYKAPTCTTKGYEAYTYCLDCGKELTKKIEIEPLGHLPRTVYYEAPTCTKTGHTEGVICERCGFEIYPVTELAKLPHDYSDGYKVTREATAFRDGEKVATCKVCGQEDKQVIKLTFWEKVVWILTAIFKPVIKRLGL